MMLDPIKQFEAWYRNRHKLGLNEPNACVLATSCGGKANNRVVLLKHYDDSGFVFYTNYRSNKAKEIENNSYASLLFYFDKTGRQIKVCGYVKKSEEATSDAYFRTRPFLSRLAAHASNQSSPMKFRYQLILKMIGLLITKRNIRKRPEFWGGYNLVPVHMEFFEHSQFRMNSRTAYHLDSKGKLVKEYLYP